MTRNILTLSLACLLPMTAQAGKKSPSKASTSPCAVVDGGDGQAPVVGFEPYVPGQPSVFIEVDTAGDEASACAETVYIVRNNFPLDAGDARYEIEQPELAEELLLVLEEQVLEELDAKVPAHDIEDLQRLNEALDELIGNYDDIIDIHEDMESLDVTVGQMAGADTLAELLMGEALRQAFDSDSDSSGDGRSKGLTGAADATGDTMNSMEGHWLVDALNWVGGIGSAEDCLDRAEERDGVDYDGDGDINGEPINPDGDEDGTDDDREGDSDDADKGDASSGGIISPDMPWLQDMVDSAGGIEALTVQIESMSVTAADYATDLRAAQTTLVDLVEE